MVGLISLDMMTVDIKRSVFSASAIMFLILGLTLVSKIITIVMMIAFGAVAGVMAYHLFLKQYVVKKEVKPFEPFDFKKKQ